MRFEILALFVGAYIIQWLLTYRQINHVKNTYLDVVRKYSGTEYFVGMNQKGKYKNGALAIVVCDDDDNIIEAKVLDGLLVTSKMKAVNLINTQQLENEEYKDSTVQKIVTKKGYIALRNAISNIKNYRMEKNINGSNC